MRSVRTVIGLAVALLLTFAAEASGANRYGLEEGSPELKSATRLAFGPEGILFVGDAKGATLFALDTGDAAGDPEKVELNVARLKEKIAGLLGTSPAETTIEDLAVNPESGHVFLAVSTGPAADSRPALLRIDGSGKLNRIGLEKIHFSQVTLPNPPADKVVGEGRRRRNRRGESITDLAYVDGKILVAGLSSADAPSTVRELAFPFSAADAGLSLEIYHGAHGRFEDYSPIRAFVPFTIDGEPSLLAGFTCTPLVKFPVKSLAPGAKLRGTTVAELGNRNRPLDMIVYEQNGKDFVLMANSSRGVMKISTENLGRAEGITEKVGGGGTAGQPYETIADLEGVVQLDRLNDAHAVILVESATGVAELRTVALP